MFKVCEERCDQCLFSKDKIVSDARRKEVLRSCEKDDKHFICHKHRDVCCRGYFDTGKSTAVQLAQRLTAMGMNVIQWVTNKEASK